ncbi:Gx transporter family protein [Pseudobutyrivibrio sp. MD2005]|uniref:Gx transporter family protein n=1 Tax=Pseudobutyrivibrio sp. MD2005 TaxID=1410616 RepID=UPI0004883063|nr:Gx transporter family protein [Pseudobutyrivibrio sp. MD2005]
MKTKRLTTLGLLMALAFVLSYVEYLLPLNIGIPGAKVGLANLVVMVALYSIGSKDALLLSFVRVLLVGFTFGNMAMMLYSMAGAVLSFFAMLLFKRTKLFTATGVSVIGGVFHNVGQIIVAIFVLETASLIYYLPFLIIIGTVSGVVIGIISSMIITRIKI